MRRTLLPLVFGSIFALAFVACGDDSESGVNCGAGTQPVDINGDGFADTCAAIGGQQQQQQQQSSLCDPGYEPRDTNGDGFADICYQVQPNPPPPPTSGCPANFPYGKDTNNDGVIDTCYANPAP